MKRQQNNGILPWLLLAIPVLWMGAVLAYAYEDRMNLFTLLGRFSILMEHPFSIRWTRHTPRFLLGALAAYGFAVTLYFSTRENRRPGEEHGSAKWGIASVLNKKYRQKPFNDNKILTQNVAIGLNGKQHRRNLNVLICGR